MPDGNPDFEPAIMKMDNTGELLWWSRLYHEIRADGSIHNSSPDQYIDGLAIDYSVPNPNSTIVVNAMSWKQCGESLRIHLIQVIKINLLGLQVIFILLVRKTKHQ